MSSGLRSRGMCGRRPRSSQLRDTAADSDDPESAPKFGVIILDGRFRRARRVVLAFDTASDADAYATAHDYVNYLVAPLSFLAPAGVPRTG
jgi:hypothetical protein